MKAQQLKRSIFLAVVLICNSLLLNAQHTDLVDSSQTQVFSDTGKKYFIPDVSRRNMRWTRSSNKLFTFQLGFAPILDYNVNIQDQESLDQVGEQESRFDLRSGRIQARGKINFKRPWSYLISIEYKGLDRTEDMNAFGMTDLKLVIPVSDHGEFVVGKIKETFVYEMVGDAANLPHQERLLNPFFNSRNNGIIYRHFFYNDRMTVSGGWFKNWPASDKSFSKTANTFTARVTGLPRWNDQGNQFMHTGIGVRYVDAQDGMIRLKGKNESNISSNYVDTKNFEGDHQWNFSIEQLWSMQNFSVLMEYAHNWSSTPSSTEQFNGYYITGSYVLSGEQRPYDKKAAYARRIKPTGNYGAWELWMRIGKVDLDSKNIEGGINLRYDLGLNWWATQHWKVGAAWGLSNLYRDELVGITNTLQFRIQWIY